MTYCTRDYILHALTSLESALDLHAESKAHLICVDFIQDILPWQFKLQERIQLSSLDEFPKTARLYSDYLQSRSRFESLVSIKPHLLLELCKSLPENDFVIYQDTDVIYFAELDDYSNFNSKHSVFFFEHAYTSRKANYPYGKYNAGFLVLRNNNSSREFLKNWSSKCHDWCFLRAENGRYADQKYLEEFIHHRYVSAEPCKRINLGMHFFEGGGKVRKVRDKVLINDEVLICFHFHGFKVHKRVTESGLNRYGLNMRNLSKFLILYLPTLMRYFEIKRNLEHQIGQPSVESIQLTTDNPIGYSELTLFRKLMSGITGTYLQNSVLRRIHLIRQGKS